MRKTLLAIAAAAMLAVGTLAPTAADARCRGCGLGLGLLGGMILGGAIASSAYAYPREYYPVEGYAPYRAYRAQAPVDCPDGYWARRPILDPYGNIVGHTRPRFFCPADY